MDHSIINADCMDAMQTLGDSSVDAIVTDPPYGLAFMGAGWDSFGGAASGRQTVSERQTEGKRYANDNKGAPRYANSHGKRVTHDEMVSFQSVMTPIFAEALRVAKPGAHLLCFGGTRTFHRLACAIEDAGWEIRDCIMWVYGSGFPKSMNVSKAIDKALGAEREKVPSTGGLTNNRNLNDDGWSKIGQTAPLMDGPTPVTDQVLSWDGWGTCLKPAWEPIIVARKPLDGTVVQNVLKHGVGAINVDACRVPTSDKLGGGMYGHGGANNAFDRPWMHDNQAQADFIERKKDNVKKSESLGRFPANLVHDGSDDVVNQFPDSNLGDSRKPVEHKRDGERNVYSAFSIGNNVKTTRHGGNGSAARFFYCAKASQKDRGEGNDHPTVKPTALMQWLVRLVCPRGGVVLDPFCGSGSTGVACVREGMGFIGIESDAHYCDIARSRIEVDA